MAEQDNFVLSTALDCCSASQKAYDGATIQSDLMHALVIDQPFSTILAFRGTKHAKDFLTDSEFIYQKMVRCISIHHFLLELLLILWLLDMILRKVNLVF